jgi:hypothetical protein
LASVWMMLASADDELCVLPEVDCDADPKGDWVVLPEAARVGRSRWIRLGVSVERGDAGLDGV